MRQRIGPKKLRRINEQTGNEYVSAWNRGGSGPWWMCWLEPGPNDEMNADYVNRLTWEVSPAFRDGHTVSESTDRA